jgi:Aspartic acid proteinase inhibitor
MRKAIRVISIFSSLCFVALGQTFDAFAQRPGAYRLVSNDDPEAVSAAKFAVSEKGRKFGKTIVLTSIVHAQKQVVSGTNYKLCLKVRVNGTSKRSEAVVYRDLQKQYSLTGWTWGQCTKPPSPPQTGTTPPSGQSFLFPLGIPDRASEVRYWLNHAEVPTSIGPLQVIASLNRYHLDIAWPTGCKSRSSEVNLRNSRPA